MTEDGSLWEILRSHVSPEYVVACVQVRRFFYEALRNRPLQPQPISRSSSTEISTSCSEPHVPPVPQADPNRGTCMDNETGLLVNHAYGLADMKASSLTCG